MLRLERARRKAFFDGVTPGIILGVVLYALAVIFLHFEGDRTSKRLTPCLLLQTSGTPCPLCGGTTAALSLATGNLSAAWVKNPFVTAGLVMTLIWAALWLIFGLRLRLTISQPILTSCLVVALILNWIYVLYG